MKIHKFKKYSTLLTFIGIILIFSVIDILNPIQEFSELENRNLSTIPEVSLESYISNDFSGKYENYINDQFFLRNDWISLKSKVEYALGKSENNNILFGEEGFLFEKYQEYDAARLNSNIDSILTFAEKYNSNTSLIVIPNSYTIYNEFLPRNLVLIDQLSVIDDISNYVNSNDSNVNMIDISKTLLDNKSEYIYYKTDHHWTSYGAYLAYVSFVNYKRLTPVDIASLKENTIDNFFGTYFNKSKYFNAESDVISYYDTSDLEVEIDGNYYDSIIDLEKLQTSDKYSAFLWGNNGLTKIINHNISEDRKGSSILVFKDSYANSFIQFLIYNYETVEVIDLRHFKTPISSFMEEGQYDDILIMYNFSNLASDINVRRFKF